MTSVLLPGLAARCSASSRTIRPSLKISSRPERGSVSNAAWNGYNPINALGLGTAALGWAAARATEASNGNLTGRERALSTAKDGLMASAVLTGVLNGIQGARLAGQAPDGAVPVETGTKPATDTPAKAAGIQRTLAVLGNLNIASGVALVAVNAILAQTNHSRPSTRRALRRSSSPNGPSPLWIGSGVSHRRSTRRPAPPPACLVMRPLQGLESASVSSRADQTGAG